MWLGVSRMTVRPVPLHHRGLEALQELEVKDCAGLEWEIVISPLLCHLAVVSTAAQAIRRQQSHQTSAHWLVAL